MYRHLHPYKYSIFFHLGGDDVDLFGVDLLERMYRDLPYFCSFFGRPYTYGTAIYHHGRLHDAVAGFVYLGEMLRCDGGITVLVSQEELIKSCQ